MLNIIIYKYNFFMDISKKKKKEFDEIFKYIGNDDFYIDIELFRNLYISDFYEHFLLYTENKINELLKITDTIMIHINISIMSIEDTYYYDKIITFIKLLHKYTKNIQKIFIYGSSSLFSSFVSLVNLTLGMNIYEKLIFSNDLSKINFLKNNLTI